MTEVWTVIRGDLHDNGGYPAGIYLTEDLAEEAARRMRMNSDSWAYVYKETITTELPPISEMFTV